MADVVELGHVVDLLEAWQHDPAGAEIIRDLKNPGVYAHDMLVLATARIFKRSWNNDVRLVKRNAATTADLSIETAAGRVAVELKAPRELDGHECMRSKSASQVAENVLSRSGKQQRTAAVSFVVVAGYRIPDEPRAALLQHFVSRLAEAPSVAGVAVLSIGNGPSEDALAAELLGQRWPRIVTPDQTTAMLALVVATNVAQSPYHRGAVRCIGLDGEGGLRLPHAVSRHPLAVDGRARGPTRPRLISRWRCNLIRRTPRHSMSRPRSSGGRHLGGPRPPAGCQRNPPRRRPAFPATPGARRHARHDTSASRGEVHPRTRVTNGRNVIPLPWSKSDSLSRRAFARLPADGRSQ